MVRRIVLCAASAAAILTLAFGQDDKVARGKYLAEEVARCQDCHTPKMETGAFIKSQWMKGSTIPLMPAAPPPGGWHANAPDITPNGALWKRWGDDAFVKFLETGQTPRAGKAGAPMPPYNLKHEDAEAIVAFLKSLQ
jgi:mono/diheme cytochrome c family protein